MPRRRPSLLVLLLVALCACVGASMSGAATSSSVVGANVLAATSLTDSCTHPTARGLGSVSISSSTLSTTGANVCRFQFGSSNGTATARLFQQDRNGTAMGGLDPTTWSASKPGNTVPTVVTVASALVSYAAFSDGTMRRSANDGSTWPTENINLPADHAIRQVAAVDADTAYAVGGYGFGNPVIRKRTLGGGVNWATQTVPGTVTGLLTDVDFLPGTPLTAIASSADGKIIQTVDGGSNWNVVHTHGGSVSEVTFLSSTLAYALGSGNTILRSVNSGGTWIAVAGIPAGSVSHIRLAPGPTLWLTIGDNLHRSQDPAAAVPAWSNLMALANSFCSFGRPSAPTASFVLVGNNCPMIYSSTNANVGSPTFNSASTVTQAPPSITHARSATHMKAASSAIMGSVNATTWGIEYQTADTAMDIDAFGSQVALLVGGTGYTWATTDGGATWLARASTGPRNMYGVQLTSATDAWAAAQAGHVLRTTNLGVSWTDIDTLVTSQNLIDVADLGDGTILAAGRSGTIVRSIDGGSTWQVVSSGTVQNLEDIEVDETTGRIWIVGGSATVLSSTDRGATFVSRPTGDTDNFQSVSWTGANSAWVSGANKSIWRTTDGGATWTPVAGGPGAGTDTIWSMDASGSEDVIYSYGSNASRARTTDGGVTWGNVGGFIGAPTVTMTDAGTSWTLHLGSSVEKQAPTVSIPDYQLGVADWSNGSAFGVCLQAVGANTTPTWQVDDGGTAGLCQASTGDDWYAVPATPTPIASTNVFGATGGVDLVWGLRTSSSQTAGRYVASISVEVIAP